MKPFRNTQYRGFSTIGSKKLSTLFDIDLVKQDLLNNFSIRKTERVRQPTYGCNIMDYIFELQTDGNVQKIVDEVIQVIENDNRVVLLDITVTEGDYSVTVDCDLLYIGTRTQFDFKVKFDAEAGIVEEIEE